MVWPGHWADRWRIRTDEARATHGIARSHAIARRDGTRRRSLREPRMAPQAPTLAFAQRMRRFRAAAAKAFPAPAETKRTRLPELSLRLAPEMLHPPYRRAADRRRARLRTTTERVARARRRPRRVGARRARPAAGRFPRTCPRARRPRSRAHSTMFFSLSVSPRSAAEVTLASADCLESARGREVFGIRSVPDARCLVPADTGFDLDARDVVRAAHRHEIESVVAYAGVGVETPIPAPSRHG